MSRARIGRRREAICDRAKSDDRCLHLSAHVSRRHHIGEGRGVYATEESKSIDRVTISLARFVTKRTDRPMERLITTARDISASVPSNFDTSA